MIDKLFFRIQLVCSTLNPIQGFMENHMHSRPSVKHVLGVLELSYVVPEKGDKDPSGLKVLAIE